jgi:hypothetical protein
MWIPNQISRRIQYKIEPMRMPTDGFGGIVRLQGICERERCLSKESCHLKAPKYHCSLMRMTRQ